MNDAEHAALDTISERQTRIESRLGELEDDVREIRKSAEARGIEQGRNSGQLAQLATEVARLHTEVAAGFDRVHDLLRTQASAGEQRGQWISDKVTTVLLGIIGTMAALAALLPFGWGADTKTERPPHTTSDDRNAP